MTTTDSKTKKASIECTTWTYGSENKQYFAEISDGSKTISSSSYESEKSARDRLGKKICALALRHERADRNTSRGIIVCGSGEVFICVWRLDSWHYDICRKGMEYASGHMGNWKTFDECYDAAKKHAADFDGIVWASRL